jgi:hypothetical protein
VSVVLAQMTLLIPAFAPGSAPPVLAIRLLRTSQRSPTIAPRAFCPPEEELRGGAIHGFGRRLEPRYVLGAGALDQ